MEIRVDTITTSPTSLLFGCVVHGPNDAWLRFCRVEVPFDVIPDEVFTALLTSSRRIEVAPVADDPRLF